MQCFEECEVWKMIFISDAETIIRDHAEESEQESEENLDVDSEEEEDNVVDKDNYLYGIGKNKFKEFMKPLMSSHFLTPQHNIVLKLPEIHPTIQ
ncbi:hypothetical protein NPIL_372481 [Nephila pilipes]|uniref:Uncharacterized protein n=1 Tax=Nephila pilipes TaxID=299642 RepID=A0A8X6UHM9_NEPPI|nr:hypothetical protein NPIL_372481 [Nephila pilipes]